MAILSLRIHVNVKTQFYLLYKSLIIKTLSKFPKLAWGGARGIRGGALPPALPAGYGPDNICPNLL